MTTLGRIGARSLLDLPKAHLHLLFETDLLREYEIARTALGLDDEQLATTAAASVEGSAAPPDLKAAALSAIAAWLR